MAIDCHTCEWIILSNQHVLMSSNYMSSKWESPHWSRVIYIGLQVLGSRCVLFWQNALQPFRLMPRLEDVQIWSLKAVWHNLQVALPWFRVITKIISNIWWPAPTFLHQNEVEAYHQFLHGIILQAAKWIRRLFYWGRILQSFKKSC